ncbi:MAG: ribonuclease E/G [Alphaproteobacteria bacterium]|nr:ribonuclease E/G [Alphaproteobacteria bacterium]
MTKNMLIDAIHPEETRVVVTDHNQIEEFDFESQSKAPLRGNIYLAKVTRVEPSLQAAFVEYGGNRHGFLAFNEIHPDYYQIPVSDREALLKEQAAEDRSQAATDDHSADDDNNGEEANEEAGEEAEAGAETEAKGEVSDIGGDAHEEASPAINTRALHRKYKIQEVIKRRQIILIQVMKEERGNKGAALTTYLSLAGRYCVLMPNTARGGGISRKINNGADRKKLKTIVGKLDVADGMGLIVRTAGAQRTLTEIRRDFQYLTRMWEDIREKTVSSTAPALVYEEGNLIRRCIRDLYSKDFDQVVIDGADSYKEAKTYMKLLMPSHARKVKQHAGDAPLFKEHGVEDKLAAMFNPTVVLPSGGYLVINPTEALVSIDVNSGKSTREQSVEKTALATNLEAAVEVARQARLRDLAGLLVIDFIDMDENRNNRAVERKMKEALKADRARIQVGRISSFGLMEMSRQRMRAGVLEGSSETCAHCNGSGMVRSVESRALHVLRQIDEDAGKFSDGELTVHLPQDVAIYLLNNKRSQLHEIETRTGVSISVEIDTDLNAMEMSITLPDNSESSGRMEGDPKAAVSDENGGKRKRRRRGGRNRRRGQGAEDSDDETESAAEDSDNDSAAAATDADDDVTADVAAGDEDGDDEDKPKRRRRRGRRGGRNRRRSPDAAGDDQTDGEAGHAAGAEPADEDAAKPQKIIIEVAAEEPEDAPKEIAEELAEEGSVEISETSDVDVEVEAETETGTDDKGKPRKSGWWRK